MVIRSVLSLSILAMTALGASGAAMADTANRCMPRPELLKQLSSLYKEAPVAIGVADNGAVFEVLASIDGATWTAVVSRSNGMSCVVMSGDTWQSAVPRTVAGLQH